MKLCMRGKFVILKICEKNSSVNLRFEIFVAAFRARKLFGTFEKRAPAVGGLGRGAILPKQVDRELKDTRDS